MKAKPVSETIREEHVVGFLEWAEGETLENINVTWMEKPVKEKEECLVDGSQRAGV